MIVLAIHAHPTNPRFEPSFHYAKRGATKVGFYQRIGPLRPTVLHLMRLIEIPGVCPVDAIRDQLKEQLDNRRAG